MRSAGSVSELASRVIITTATRTAGDPMNNCEFNGFVMPGGWTDRGRYAYGMFWQYQNNERAIHSIMMSNKGDDLRSVFYVDGAAFPVFAFIEDGLSISAPGADLVVNDTTYKFGATNPANECIAADVILDFKSGRGFYESHSLIVNDNLSCKKLFATDEIVARGGNPHITHTTLISKVCFTDRVNVVQEASLIGYISAVLVFLQTFLCIVIG